LGWQVIGWATDVVADFFGDEWFRRNLENFSHPLLSMYDHPLSNRIAAVRHIERAARIALLISPAGPLLAYESTRTSFRPTRWETTSVGSEYPEAWRIFFFTQSRLKRLCA
jgi:hypothetical protein